MSCQDEPVIVRAQQDNDYEAIRYVYAEAFRRPRFRPPPDTGSVPPEVGLFEALWAAGDVIPEFSFTALTDMAWSGTLRRARRPSRPTQLLPWGRSASFRIFMATASGAP